jgi:hypothetical protein
MFQVDSTTVEGKIFPRADALAERLWSNPQEKWYKAEQRMLQQRWRLTHRGIKADALQPEWCRLNGGQCYWKNDKPGTEFTNLSIILTKFLLIISLQKRPIILSVFNHLSCMS